MNPKTNPELIPLIDWWRKDGKKTVALLLVAALAVAGWYWWKSQRAAVQVAVRNAVDACRTSAQYEEACARYSKTEAAVPLKYGLAKAYFDEGRYEDALSQYEALAGQVPEALCDAPIVGKAHCLEALGKYAEAQKTFDDYIQTHTNSFLKLSAQLGAARCLALAGDKKAADGRLASLKADVKGNADAEALVEAAQAVVKRIDPARKAKKAQTVSVPPLPAEPAAKPAEPAEPAAK